MSDCTDGASASAGIRNDNDHTALLTDVVLQFDTSRIPVLFYETACHAQFAKWKKLRMNSARAQSAEPWRNRKVTILGLGSFGGGVAVAKFLAAHRAEVTVTDLKSADELAESLKQLKDVPLRATHLGSHPDEALRDCELLVVNPAVRPDSAVLIRAVESGVQVTSEMEVFLNHCRGRIIAVTGSNGKSTTAALTHHLLQRCTAGKVWLGGNIGISLLPVVNDICTDDWVVLELSSFQLEYLRDADFRPQIAVVTNFAQNHLDWHGDVSRYQAAKQVLLNHQQREDVTIVADDMEVNIASGTAAPWRVRGECLRFGTTDSGEDGVFVDEGLLVFRRQRAEDVVRFRQPSQLPGAHNAKNIAAAACAAWAAAASPEMIVTAVAGYEQLPHRLQVVASAGGIRFYNDSVATTPESSIAALQSLPTPVVIIAGGSDKRADLTSFARQIRQTATAAVLIGQTAETLAGLIRGTDHSESVPVHVATDIDEAFRRAVDLVPEGGIVLLSPGCASYGLFRDYRERGDRFIQLATDWVQNQ